MAAATAWGSMSYRVVVGVGEEIGMPFVFPFTRAPIATGRWFDPARAGLKSQPKTGKRRRLASASIPCWIAPWTSSYIAST